MINLKVFQKAYRHSLDLHKASLGFPALEQTELARQLRRASKSVCANLAEGFGKNQSQKEKRRYVQIARGSNEEVKLWLIYAKDLGYLDERAFGEFWKGYDEIGRMLYGLSEKLRS